jgi:hypothetical protein
MKRIILTLSLVLIQFATLAQAPAIDWQKSIGGSAVEEAKSIQQTTDGGYILTGYTESNNGNVTGNQGNSDYWVVKLSVIGTIQWQKTLGGTGDDYAQSIQQTTDGGYIVAGYTNSNDGNVTGNHGNNDYWVVKLSAAGAIEWQKTLGGAQNDLAHSIQQTSDGGYIVAGHTNSNNGDVTGNHGGVDYWIVKLSVSGTILWQKTLGGTVNDFAISIQQTTDGGYIVAGYAASIDGDVTGLQGGFDYWVVKLTATATKEWEKTAGGSSTDIALSITQTNDAGYIVAGVTRSNDGDVTGNYGGFGYDSWIVKLSSTGTIQWAKTMGGTNDDVIWSIKQMEDGTYIAGGFTASNDGDVSGNHGGYDVWVVKLTTTGNILWQKMLGGTGSDGALSIQQTSDGGYIAAGSSSWANGDVTENQGSNDYWVVKLATDSLNTSDILKNDLKVFPNPTKATLTFQNPNNVTIDKISITDLAGKTILQLEQNATQINVEQLATGMYILQAYSGEEKYTTKFIKK